MAALPTPPDKKVVLRSGGPVMRVGKHWTPELHDIDFMTPQTGPTRWCYWNPRPPNDNYPWGHWSDEFPVECLVLAEQSRPVPPAGPLGSLVRRTSGGPVMVVSNVFEDMLYECMYFEGDVLRRVALAPLAVRVCAPPSKVVLYDTGSAGNEYVPDAATRRPAPNEKAGH